MAAKRRCLTRIPPGGRRAAIIRATTDNFRSMSDIDRFVRKALPSDRDPSIDRLKTSEALRDLRRAALVDATPYGWRATPAGLELLARSEARAKALNSEQTHV